MTPDKELAQYACDMLCAIEDELPPDITTICIQQKGPGGQFKPDAGETFRAYIATFRNPEELADALAEPDPKMMDEVRAARRDVPDELVILLYHDEGSMVLTIKRKVTYES